jgi:hypothetical protein
MTPDQIAGTIGIAAMLLIVVDRLARDRAPKHKMLRMALIWVAIVAVITAIALATQR